MLYILLQNYSCQNFLGSYIAITILLLVMIKLGFPGEASGKDPACQCRRL